MTVDPRRRIQRVPAAGPLVLFAALLAVAASAADPVVSDVALEQRAGTELVDITYTVRDADSTNLGVTIAISTNDGVTFDVPAPSLSDGSAVRSVGLGVEPGLRRWVVWNAGADWDGRFSSQVRARVTADDAPPPAGMVLIPAGSFRMGNCMDPAESRSWDPATGRSWELPVHTVSVSAFYIDRCILTKALWDEITTWAKGQGYDIEPAGGSGKATNHPAFNLTWYESVKACNARSEKEGLTPCYTVSGGVYRVGSATPDCNWSANGYRLPTEAEWERAARGGVDGRRFPWGDTIDHSQANYCGDPDRYSYDLGYALHDTRFNAVPPYTSAVGSFAANGFGLFDTVGNIWEWCWDWHEDSYYEHSPAVDPKGPATGTARALRGGAWGDSAEFARVARRYFSWPYHGDNPRGLRCVRRP